MKHLLRKCSTCHVYTLKICCPRCSKTTSDPAPAKFSPDDKYLMYRISGFYEFQKEFDSI